MANPYAPPTQDAVQGGFATGGGTAEGYEFDGMENAIIDRTGKRAHTWGVISYVGAALLIVTFLILLAVSSSLASDAGPLAMVVATLAGAGLVIVGLSAVIYAVLGKLYTDAGSSLRQVVISQGDDITHTMHALQKFGRAFQVEAALTIVLLVVTLALRFFGAAAAGGL